MKKKTSIFFIFLFVSVLFFIPNGINNNHFVSAEVGEEFILKDTFEDSNYQNRLYTEYDNHTQEEYFRDEKYDSVDFTTDKDGFEVTGGATDNGISNGYYEILATGDNQGIVYSPDFVNFTTYTKLEFRVWLNVTTDYLYFMCRNDTDNWIGGFGYGDYIPANEWVILNYDLETITNGEYLVDDIRFFSIYIHSAHDDYPVLIRYDYIRIYKNGYSDYSYENGDSWDFGEGDNEDFSLTFGVTGTDVVENGYQEWVKTDTAYYTYLSKNPDIDGFTYNNYCVRVWSNSSDYAIQYRFRNSLGGYTSNTIGYTIANEWVTVCFDLLLENNWNGVVATYQDNFGIILRETTQLELTDMFRIDYILLLHDDLEDIEQYTNQEVTTYRAYEGMYSFEKMNISNYFEYYEGFTANLNMSVKIDIPSLEYLPKFIRFNYYSTTEFMLYLIVDTTYYLLYNNYLYKNEWMYIYETIERSEILINDTECEVYFEIVLNNTMSHNEFFIDELALKYTEPAYNFEHSIHDNYGGIYDDRFLFNSTNTQFRCLANPDNIGNSFSGLTQGLVYNSTSDNIFTRRMYNDYYVSSNESEVTLSVRQETTIEVDKTYKIVSSVTNKQKNLGDYLNRYVDYIVEMHIDGNKEWELVIDDFIFDIALDNYHSMNVEFLIVQEDYNTITLETIYINTFTGNRTTFQPFSFNINRDNDTIHNALNNVMIQSYITVTPSMKTFLPMVTYYESNPEINGKITRDLKHSPITSPISSGLETGQMPVWDKNHPFLSFFALLGYYIQQFINYIVEQFKVAGYIKDILTNIVYFFSSQIEAMSNLFTVLGEIDNILDLGNALLDYIWDVVSNVFDYLGEMGQALIDLIIEALGNDLLAFPILDSIMNAFSDFLGGDWESFGTAWSEIMPTLDYETVERLMFIPNAFMSLFIGDTTFLTTAVYTFITITTQIYVWISVLAIMYLVYLSQMVVRRDFDRLRIEVTTWANIINWIIDTITFVFHWIFELVHAVLDVSIPFT